MDEQIILQTRHLTKKFKNILAVENLNISVYRGDIFGFLGPNGAGKSTTIRMILGLIKPTSGDVSLFEKSLRDGRHEILKKVGALVEKPSFYNYLSARRNLEIFSAMIKNDDAADIDRVLEIVELRHRADDHVKTYSQGMKQRLGIAQALLGKPQLIILDEPTSGLDPVGMKDIRRLILQLARQGMTIFLSSHLLHEVEQTCTKMAIINSGQLIIQGDVRKLLEADSNFVMLKVDRPHDAMNLLQRQNWITKVDMKTDYLQLRIEYKLIPRMNKLLIDAGFDVFAIEQRRSLEDFFLNMLGAGV